MNRSKLPWSPWEACSFLWLFMNCVTYTPTPATRYNGFTCMLLFCTKYNWKTPQPSYNDSWKMGREVTIQFCHGYDVCNKSDNMSKAWSLQGGTHVICMDVPTVVSVMLDLKQFCLSFICVASTVLGRKIDDSSILQILLGSNILYCQSLTGIFP